MDWSLAISVSVDVTALLSFVFLFYYLDWCWFGAMLVIGFCTLCYWWRQKRTDKLLAELMAADDDEDIRENTGHLLKVFSAAAILVATDGFGLQNKLGEGGFGPVYKGRLGNGREIAVKRLSKGSGQGVVEFRNELIVIARLQHTNLVKLLGCCIHGREKILVYEYVPNRSLDCFIFDDSKRKMLDWNKRFGIIEGIAQGLLYLHKFSRVRIIHRDLKASNILLDEKLNPRISDFGMACIFDGSESNTERVVGTLGYMSPEYATEGIFSAKSDVYSFGVLILEIVSGRKCKGFVRKDLPLSLVGYAWQLWKEGKPLKLMDSSLGEGEKEQMMRCINIGLLCVENRSVDRPTMSEVVRMLTSTLGQELPRPVQPAFSAQLEKNGMSSSSNNTNVVSITTMCGR